MLLRIFDPTTIPTEMPWPILYMLLFITVPCIPSIIKLLIQVENNKAWLKNREEFAEYSAKVDACRDKLQLPAKEEMNFQLKFKIYNSAFIESVYEELKDDLITIFGEDYKTEFKLPGRIPSGCDFSYPDNTTLWAMYLMLAKQGKVTWFVFDYGFKLGTTDAIPWQVEILKRIEHYLVQAHPEEGDNVRLYQIAPPHDVDGNLMRLYEVIDPRGLNGTLADAKVGLGVWNTTRRNGRRLWRNDEVGS